MQSGYIRVNFASFLKLLAVILTISTCGCSFNLEKPQLPNYLSCQSNKCCCKIGGDGSTQICGAGSLNELQFQVKYTN